MSDEEVEQVAVPNEITLYFHCGHCMRDHTKARLEVGWTDAGIQVWCRNCQANLMHINFEGHKHVAQIKRLIDPLALLDEGRRMNWDIHPNYNGETKH